MGVIRPHRSIGRSTTYPARSIWTISTIALAANPRSGFVEWVRRGNRGALRRWTVDEYDAGLERRGDGDAGDVGEC